MNGMDRQVATSINVQSSLSGAQVPLGSTESGAGSAGSMEGTGGLGDSIGSFDGVGGRLLTAGDGRDVAVEASGLAPGDGDEVVVGTAGLTPHAARRSATVAIAPRDLNTRKPPLPGQVARALFGMSGFTSGTFSAGPI